MPVTRLYSYGFAIPRPTGIEGRLQWDVSEEFMLKDLAKSGLVPEDIGAYPVILNLPQKANAAYVIPYVGKDGRYLGDAATGTTGRMHRVRAHYPDTLSRADLNTLPKYMQPSRAQIGAAAVMPYIPALCRQTNGGTLFIVEGEKKCALFSKRWVLPCIALGGCSMWVNPDPHGGKLHPDIEELLEKQAYENVVIIPDGDVRRLDISREYKGLATALIGIGLDVDVVNFSLFNPDKLDDWLVANPDAGSDVMHGWAMFDINHMAENVRDLIREYRLLNTENQRTGAITLLTNEANIMALLGEHPAFKGVVRLNEDTLSIDKGITPMHVTTELQTVFSMPSTKLATVKACVAATAENNPYSPIRDWLKGLVWDRKLRLDKWLTTCLGADDTPYTREVGKKALVGAVARRFEPGCMVDFMTILQGEQGIGKSSAIRMVFGKGNTWEYSRGTIEGKDWILAAHMSWCVADEELGALRASALHQLKAQITTRMDLVRAPYAADTKAIHRRFVWWGSTNADEFLPEDYSGQRRYAVIRVKQVDFKRLEAVREQLLAEAVYRYMQGFEYSNITGTSEAVQQYVLSGIMVEQVESVLEQWWSGKQGREQIVEHEGQQWRYVRLTQLAAVIGMPIIGQRAHELGSAMVKLGFRKVRQKKINGQHFNSVYLYPLVSPG